jgi:hypothetical protein
VRGAHSRWETAFHVAIQEKCVLVHGVGPHELFHAGQILVLMEAQGLTPIGD